MTPEEFDNKLRHYFTLAIIGFMCWFIPVSVSTVIIIISALVNYPDKITWLAALAALFLIGCIITYFFHLKVMRFIIVYDLLKTKRNEDAGFKR